RKFVPCAASSVRRGTTSEGGPTIPSCRRAKASSVTSRKEGRRPSASDAPAGDEGATVAGAVAGAAGGAAAGGFQPSGTSTTAEEICAEPAAPSCAQKSSTTGWPDHWP